MIWNFHTQSSIFAYQHPCPIVHRQLKKVGIQYLPRTLEVGESRYITYTDIKKNRIALYINDVRKIELYSSIKANYAERKPPGLKQARNSSISPGWHENIFKIPVFKAIRIREVLNPCFISTVCTECTHCRILLTVQHCTLYILYTLQLYSRLPWQERD